MKVTVTKKPRNSTEKKVNAGCGCFGCLSVIAFGLVIWALIFGVTVAGVHYGLTCSMERGVEVVTE